MGESDAPFLGASDVPTLLMASMVQMHEIYSAAMEAGFSEHQAMEIVLEMVRMSAPPST